MLSLFFALGQFEIFIITFCVAFFHEMGHITSAKIFGFKVKRISIFPFGVNSEIDFSKSSFKKLLVIYSGPFVNVVLIFLSLRLNKNIEFVNINIYMLLVNLLPVYPLDGGRALCEFINLNQTNIKMLKFVSCLISAFVVCVGCLYMIDNLNCSLLIIGLFLISQIKSIDSINMADEEFVFYGKCENLWVYSDVEIYKLAGKLSYEKFVIIYVVERKGDLLGVTTNKVLFNALTESKYHNNIKELIISGGENERF